MINRYLFHIFFFFLLVSGCKKDVYETVNRSYGKGYVNTKIGAYNIYKVEEIIYDDFSQTVDTFRYQLKEVNESMFSDNLNRKALRVERYKLNNKSQWEIFNVWYTIEDNVAVEKIEDNKRLVKLSFPLSDEVVWNLNAYNSENSMYVYYDFIHQKYKMDTFLFDSAVAVKSDAVNSSVRQRQYIEIYAKNIGLVYKNIVSIDRNGLLQRGFRYKQELIKHVP